MGPVYIGTSGWSYKGWQKTFYPSDVAVSRQFEFYATQFSTVEINATFYRLPKKPMVEGWARKAPPGFVYAIKGSLFITHMKKLANLDGAVNKFFDHVAPLKRKTAVVLWQLPPNLGIDLPRLDEFLGRLPASWRYAVEFRHPSWIEESTFQLLEKHRVAHASVSSLRMPKDLTVTADLVYLRFHGLEGGAAHDYSRRELQPWDRHIREQSRAGKTVFAYFNNDWNVRAPANALTLIDMTEGRAARPAYRGNSSAYAAEPALFKD